MAVDCASELYKNVQSINFDCENINDMLTSGGLKKIELGAFTAKNSEPATWETLEFNNNDKQSNYTENLTNNDNGTTVVTKTLTVFLTGFEAERHESLNELCNPFKKLVIRITFADGSVALQGLEFGAVLTSVKFETGANATDTNGVTLSFTCDESKHNINAGTSSASTFGLR
jgi:hypothetical protein